MPEETGGVNDFTPGNIEEIRVDDVRQRIASEGSASSSDVGVAPRSSPVPVAERDNVLSAMFRVSALCAAGEFSIQGSNPQLSLKPLFRYRGRAVLGHDADDHSAARG